MKKLFLILSFVSMYAFTPVCEVFSDVLQTRHNPSQITMKGNGYIYNSPSCSLNTGSIYQGRWWPKLKCNSGATQASGNYGESLTINYSFLVDNTSVNSNPSSSATNKNVVSSTTLSDSEYNKVDISNGTGSAIKVIFNSLATKKINELLFNQKVEISFENSSSDLLIGDVGDSSSWNEDIYIHNTDVLHNIKIKNIYLKANGDINFEANNLIEIHHLEIGRDGSEVVLKAPKIVIDELLQTNSSSGSSLITIYADEIDISGIDLGQDATLIIHPYTPNKNIILHSNFIKSSSSSSVIVDSGDYYTNLFDIPGTSGVSSIRAGDNSQIINLFINGDFNPGNNPGINSAGNNGNFGSLIPANFRMFINGDLDTGGGGTTFNALVYVEGDVSLGSPTYVKGGISANEDIKIYNNSKFYYDSSIETSDLGGFCGGNFNFDTRYSCSIFPSVLTSYTKLTTASNDIFDTCELSAGNLNYVETGSTNCNNCSCSNSCNSNSSCHIIEAPKNKYTHNVFVTTDTSNHIVSNNIVLNDIEYGNYTFNSNNQQISLSPDNSYDNNTTKLMVLGDFIFDKNHQLLNLDEGDYYFNSFVSNGSHFQMCLTGNVRIFVKNNFELNGDNIDIDCGGKLLVYTEGNAVIGHNGGGRNNIHFYLYSKGDVLIRNNGNASNIYGAITAEGDLDVTGNNVNFHYDTDYLKNFGLDECKLCYDENFVSKNGFSMFMFSMCTPFTPCIFDMPIRNTDNKTLDDVKVIETYKQSSTIAMNFFGMYADTLDRDGNHVGNGASTTSSSDYSMFGIVNLGLTSTSTTYDFGDNYPTYQPNQNYYRAYRSSTMSFSMSSPQDMFNKWKNDVVYLAEYNSEGKDYAIQIESCPNINEDRKPTGFLDAWDDYTASRGKNDRNISTKIVNKPFELTIAYIPTGYLVNTNSATVKYYLKDMNTSNIISSEDYLTILSNSYTTDTKTFTVNKASKEAKVEFKTCANYDSTIGYTLYPYSNCSSTGDCSSNTLENTICYRYFTSTDSFAIRPNKFKIIGTGVGKADNNITFLTIKAVDYNGNSSNNYDEESLALNLDVIDDLCVASSINYNFSFDDGMAKINSLKYPEVGEIKLKISEVNGDEFAFIDSDDTNGSDRFIESNISSKFTILPDHFEIGNIKVNNFNNGSFTYLSNDLNMSGELNVTIKAKNSNNVITTNYDESCYAKNVEVNVSHSSNTVMDNLNYIITQNSVNNKDNNISFTFNKNNFVNGEADVNVKINFDRNSSKVVEPFTLTLNSINVTDENNTIGNSSINLDLNFIYGKIYTDDVVTLESNKDVIFDFVKFNGSDWVLNEEHNNTYYGEVNGSYNKSFIDVTPQGIVNGREIITFTPKTPKRPYKVKLHFSVPSWLWYSNYGIEYKEPDNSNSDCMTHPCVNLLFLGKANKSWGGVGTNRKENNVSRNAIDVDVEQNHIQDKKYQKIFW